MSDYTSSLIKNAPITNSNKMNKIILLEKANPQVIHHTSSDDIQSPSEDDNDEEGEDGQFERDEDMSDYEDELREQVCDLPPKIEDIQVQDYEDDEDEEEDD
jgi:hypothetical protein